MHDADPSSAWVVPGTVLGHEVVGRVREVGANIRGLSVGQRVVPMSVSGCDACERCEDGLIQRCAQREWLGLSRDGGLADSLCVPARTVHPVGDLPVMTAVLTEPMSVAVRAVVQRGGAGASDHVVVSGCGAIGLLAGIVALSIGARVTVLGTSTDIALRSALCSRLGLTLTTDTQSGVDLWIEASGAPSALEYALQSMNPGGRVVLVGLYGRPLNVDLDTAVRQEISVIASYAGDRDDYRSAIKLLTTMPDLGVHFVLDLPITSADAAFAALSGGERPKIALRPERKAS